MTEVSEKALVLQLAGGPEAAAMARQAVLDGDGTLPAAVRHDVLLLMTEVVTNAVRHGGVGPERSLRLEVGWTRRQVRVQVFDPGVGFAQISERPIQGDEWGGWGLYLVDRIADSWGVRRANAGTCVWFEIQFGG